MAALSACGSSRRRFLASLAGMEAGLLFGQPLAAQLVDAQPRWIDVHHHFAPPFYVAETRDVVTALVQWTTEKSLAEMDKYGVITALLSISTPGIWFGDVSAARTMARKCNEYAAQLIRDHPGRFGLFAAIPLPDTEGSLQEIAYALDVLKADGIGLLTSYGDKWPGDPAFQPVLEELNRRKAIVYIHPTAPSCCRNLMSYVPVSITEFIQDTNRAVTSLLYSGSFSRFREIRFIFSHAGGAIPTLAGRIAQLGRTKDLPQKAPSGIEYELKRLYYEVANSANRSAMAALTNLIPTSQILFGTDYPPVPIGVTAVGLTHLGLSSEELQAIGRDNALALVPRLKA